MASLAQMERELLAERTRAGLDAAGRRLSPCLAWRGKWATAAATARRHPWMLVPFAFFRRDARKNKPESRAEPDSREYTCKVKLKHAAKPHATIDFAIEEGPEDYKGKKSKAIYKLDGTEITMCVRHPEKTGPRNSSALRTRPISTS
jgi:uncharacterized protein (TIGR03067 family)